MSNAQKNVYTIPAGAPMAKALAQHILYLYDTPEALSQVQIFLPTKRACRILGESFLALNGSDALILPKMQALGDIDEEELSLWQLHSNPEQELLRIPPALSHIRRQILLARLIHARDDYTQGFDHALKLANALGQLMDHIYTEDLNLADLHDIVPDNFAQHWQITLDFLKIISEFWPKILQENNMIDAADRRNRILKALTSFWQDNPPQTPIIAAGSTGSIPTTAEFLACAANLPNGCVILPGLDQSLDEESRQALNEAHPQYGLYKLLKKINISSENVQVWPGTYENSHAKQILAREIMRPAETTSKWSALAQKSQQDTLLNALQTIDIIECESLQEEAATIALAIRDTLETPDKTVTLITADRDLAKRVQDFCQRWEIAVDDSAGEPLSHSNLGRFLRAIVHAVDAGFSPVLLSTFIKNQYFRMGYTLSERRELTAVLDLIALRGLKPKSGLETIQKILEDHETDTSAAQNFVQVLQEKLRPLIDLCTKKHSFQKFLHAHITCAEDLYSAENEQTSALWSGDEGQAASKLFSNLIEETRDMPDVSFEEYIHIFQNFIDGALVRPRYGMHPRVNILGQLEARLVDSDVLILGALNEGKWPRDPGHDPWMSRQMQQDFGLPNAERSIGLSAHDFVQGFCAKTCIITRAKMHGTEPSLPSRWLQRLDKVIEAAGLEHPSSARLPYRSWARALDQAEEYTPCERPAPKPDVSARPSKISATRIESWLKDPYSLYAHSVLRLRPQEPFEKPLDHAEKGTFIHETLHRFVQAHKNDLPDKPQIRLSEIAEGILNEYHSDTRLWADWAPRMHSIFDQFITLEQDFRDSEKPLVTECYGEAQINTHGQTVTITAKADRINLTPHGLSIIDYKTGTNFSVSAIKTAKSPQLLIEALIAHHEGFTSTQGHNLAKLEYWLIPGSESKSKVITIDEGIEGLIEQTEAGVKRLIEGFADTGVPYYSIPDSTFLPTYNDYEHLARISEWAVLDTEANE